VSFNSVTFLVFLAVMLLLFWWQSNRRGTRSIILLLGSYLFYGAYESWYLGLILGSTFLDYFCGARIHEAREAGQLGRAKKYVWLSLFGNIGALVFFKITDWVILSLQTWADAAGMQIELWDRSRSLLPPALLDSDTLKIVVPVGISFYTFQTVSYTIDIYRGVLKPARNLRDFALFVAFFPQLVAGPIVRAVEFLPQLELRPRMDRERLHDGIWRISTGLLKKVALADVIGQGLVDPVYAAPEEYAIFVKVLALYAFSFQMYLDFSGYSDVAIGVARLLGFDLPENFRRPYGALSVRDFWRKWHMTLSTWVRDYVFFPLGGSRGTEVKVARNLFVTMIVLGIWHGASILWVGYGVFHSIVMIGERLMDRVFKGEPWAKTPARKLLLWFWTFSFVTFTTIFARARSLDQMIDVLVSYGEQGLDKIDPWALAAFAFAAASHFWPWKITKACRKAVLAMPTWAAGILMGVTAGVVAVLVVGDTPYIYFAF
jgi:D-alanyl-lipoteichoic acid acyltransferase DltB (MBOAT superfamily)